VFGVALLAAALIFLKNAVPAARPLFSAAGWVALAAAGVAAAGVLLGALQGDFHGPALRSVAKGIGVALVVLGIVYASGAADARERRRAAAAGVAWTHDETAALALARAEGRPVILDFWAEWCTACKELDRTAWADPAVRGEAARFVAVKVDGTDDTPAFQALTAKYAVVGMPTVVFLDGRGREVPLRVTGTIDGPEMLQALRGVDHACGGPVPAHADPLAPEGPPGAALAACAPRW
jgi:thiol:disulfide interchange protein DsbD